MPSYQLVFGGSLQNPPQIKIELHREPREEKMNQTPEQPKSHEYYERNYRIDLAYNLKKKLLIEMGFKEEQAQDGYGIPTHLLNAIDSTLDMWIIRNNAFQRA